MADAPEILKDEKLRDSYPKLNAAIRNSNEALSTASTAKSTADTAKNTADTALANSENTQTQLDTIVINGDSSVEAAQARVAADGSTYTTLQERLNSSDAQLAETKKYANVKKFGAKGDGVTDDTTAFQNAVDFANSNGLDLYIPSGDHIITTLNLKSSVYGNGKTSVIKCKDINISNVSNITVQGLRIVTSANLDGVKIIDSPNVTVSRLLIESTYTGSSVPLPLTVERCDHFKLEHSVMLVGNLQIKTSKNIKVLKNVFDGQLKNNHDLIKCTHRTSGIIDGNTLVNSTGDAIDSYTSGERMVITNNHIENMKNSGIEAKVILRDSPYTGGSSDQDGFVESVIISNNIFKNIGGAVADNYGAIKNIYSDLRAAQTFEQKNTPRSFIITNNIIEDINLTPGASGDYHGIVTDAHNSLIANNIIRNVYKGNGGVNSGTGIYFAGKAADCVVEGNVISGAQTNGIYASANRGLNISGNNILKDKVSNVAQVYGLRLSALEKCSIVNNLISDSSTYAIYASGDLAKTNISGNTLENGAEFVKLTDVRITNNDVTTKSLIVGSSSQLSNRVSVIGNHVRETGTSAGVFLRNVKGAILTNNMFHSVSYGAVIQNESTYVQAKNNTTGNQLNVAAEGITFSAVTTTNQATSVVSGNMVIPA